MPDCRNVRASAHLGSRCALRLDRYDRLVPLEPAEVAELRASGHHAWMDRLMAELRARSARVGEAPAGSDAIL